MIQSRNRFIRAFLSVLFLLGVSQIASAQQGVVSSTLGHYQAYVSPWIGSLGTPIGLEVHYSVGALQDLSGPAMYTAVCFLSPTTPNEACVDPSARVWARTNSYSVGSWLVQTVPLDCANVMYGRVQVLQPYVRYISTLNFAPWGQSPYQGTQLFFSGSTDTASIITYGCNASAVP